MRLIATLILLSNIAWASKEATFKEICKLALEVPTLDVETPGADRYLELVSQLGSDEDAVAYLTEQAERRGANERFVARLILYRIARPEGAATFIPFFGSDNVTQRRGGKSQVVPLTKPFPLKLLAPESQQLAKSHFRLFKRYARLGEQANKRLRKEGDSESFRGWLMQAVDKVETRAARELQNKKDRRKQKPLPEEMKLLLQKLAFAAQIPVHHTSKLGVRHHDWQFKIREEFHPFLCEAAVFSRNMHLKSQFIRLASSQSVEPAFYWLLITQFGRIHLPRSKKAENRDEILAAKAAFGTRIANGLYLRPHADNVKNFATLIMWSKRDVGNLGSAFYELARHQPKQPEAREWQKLLADADVQRTQMRYCSVIRRLTKLYEKHNCRIR